MLREYDNCADTTYTTVKPVVRGILIPIFYWEWEWEALHTERGAASVTAEGRLEVSLNAELGEVYPLEVMRWQSNECCPVISIQRTIIDAKFPTQLRAVLNLYHLSAVNILIGQHKDDHTLDSEDTKQFLHEHSNSYSSYTTAQG